LFILVGIVGNAFVVLLVPVTPDVPVRARAFYIALAVAELVVIIFMYILVIYPLWGIPYVNGGVNVWSILRISSASRIAVLTIWDISKGSSAFLIAAFAAQRAFVITFPLKAHILTSRQHGDFDGYTHLVVCSADVHNASVGLLHRITSMHLGRYRD
jgi:hypothetical protein